jgi:hypothetical protein
MTISSINFIHEMFSVVAKKALLNFMFNSLQIV